MKHTGHDSKGRFTQTAMAVTYTSDADRFWSKVDRGQGACWLWRAARQSEGYGIFSIAGKLHYAHRVSYEMTRGPIPVGLTLDHICRVRHCVNPDHLEAVPKRINSLRGIGPTAIHARKTHCIRGHPFDQTNTYRRPDTGGRQCRICLRLSKRARYVAGYRVPERHH